MESVNDAIERVKTWFYQQLEVLKQYPLENHRLIILLSILDSFAQESIGYSRNSQKNQKAFADFIQTYSTRHQEVLNTLCPVTLYYSKYNENDDIILQLRCGTIHLANSPIAITEAQRLFEKLTDEQKQSVQLKHSYAGLIYQLRNKLVHESTVLNMPINFQYDEDVHLPHMVCENRIENYIMCPKINVLKAMRSFWLFQNLLTLQ